MKKKMAHCPRCNKNYDGKPALSRRDNITDICPMCGTQEALIDAGVLESDYVEMNFRKKLEKIKELSGHVPNKCV